MRRNSPRARRDVARARSECVDAALSELPKLLAHLIEQTATVAVYQRRTGSDEYLVGVATTVDNAGFHMAEIEPNGRYSGDDVQYALDDIIRISWDDDYVLTLRELADGDDPPSH